MLISANGRDVKKSRAKPMVFFLLFAVKIKYTRYEKPSNAAKYFDRNAKPKNTPANAYQPAWFCFNALNKAAKDKKEKRMRLVSVVIATLRMLSGEIR